MSTNRLNEEIIKLKSKSLGERKKAAWVLGDLGDKRAVEHLIISLKNEPDRFVRINIVKALAKLGDKRAIPFLSSVREKDKDLKVRKEASWAYFKIKEGQEKSSTKVTKTVMKTPVKKSSIGKHSSISSFKRTSVSSLKNHESKMKQSSIKPLSKPVKIESKHNPLKVSPEKKSSFQHSKNQKIIPRLPEKTPTKPFKKSDSMKVFSNRESSHQKLQKIPSATKTIVKINPIKNQNSKNNMISQQKPKEHIKERK